MDYGGLPFLGTGCPVPNSGFNYFMDLYRVLEMDDAL